MEDDSYQVFWNMHPIYKLPAPELQPVPQLGLSVPDMAEDQHLKKA